MLSPQVSRQLKQLLAFYEKGVFVEQEFSLRLASLVSQENAVDMLDALPPEALPRLKEAVVAAAQDAVDADCLCPEESVLQENTVIATYYLRVAEVLLERSAARPRPGLTVVCLPSFEVEWALRVRGSAKIGFTAILTEAEEKIWCHVAPRSIQVRAKQKALDAGLGEALCEVWKQVLLRTRHPRRGRQGLDGVSYHFACSELGVGSLAGRTWSPESATVPGRLVAISHALREYLEASEAETEQVRGKLDSCIAEI
jgi:hypothetical protein